MSYLIINGDCRRMPIDLVGVDAVVTDPPYGIGFVGKGSRDKNGKTIIRKGTYKYIEDTPEYIRDCVVPLIDRCRREVKVVSLTPGKSNLWLYPSPDDMGCLYQAGGSGLGRWGFSCFHPILYYGKDPHIHKGATPNSLCQIYANDANQWDHPCAKPLAMMLWLVKKTTLPGWTVLDPFMGVGTTGVACMMLGRNFVGIEIDPRYCAIARRRIERPHASVPRPGRAEHHPLFDVQDGPGSPQDDAGEP
jgi:DNA modification methylase